MKPIKIYWRNITPNPSKVLIILEELGLPYESTFIELEDLKKEPYESVNPNGRVPAVHDPNENITIWESNAIIHYLIDVYDKEHKLTYTSAPEKYLLQQWSFFQSSGQGPYFGQAAWFNKYHPERLESASARYENEVRRVVGVLDRALKGREWLVGDKCTYADLVFVMWNSVIPILIEDRPSAPWTDAEFPNFKKWQEAMLQRESVKKVFSVNTQNEVSSKGKM